MGSKSTGGMDVGLLCVLCVCCHLSLVQEQSYRLWHALVCDQEPSCEEVAKKKRAEPLGNACRKNQHRKLGQNKITS
jgi:hypothetical protein